MNKKEAAKAEAVKILKQWGVKNGTTIFARVAHVSRSGMFRRVQLSIVKGGRPVDISYWAAKVLEWGYKEGYAGGIAVGGCGMDMLFHTVYSLSYGMGYGAMAQRSEDKTGLRYRSL